MNPQTAKLSEDDYIVVLRGRSSARFRSAEGVALTFTDPSSGAASVHARIRTRWVDEGFESALPRELWIDARLRAASLDAACSEAGGVAHLLSVLATFCANVTGEVPEVHLAYRQRPQGGRREFVEIFLPDQTGVPGEGRAVEVSEYVQVFEAVNSSEEKRRIVRALNQYQIALRYWYLGGEWLSLTHLYMAVEALTKAVICHECSVSDIDTQELARRHDIDPDDPERPRWQPALESWARAHLIFGDDNVTYSAARNASDGIEHGFMEYDEINQHAMSATLATFGYVRRTILRLLGLSQQSELAQRQPLDVSSLRKMVRGHFIGDVDDPAPPDSEYPHLEWNSSLRSFRQVNDQFVFTPQEVVTVRCADGIGFQGQSFEVRGRNQSGGFQMQEEEVIESNNEATPASRLLRTWDLVRRVQSVVALPLTEIVEGPERIAFSIFAEHVAIFEAATNLVAKRRPVESLILVQKGVESTCRLQLMADPDSGMGWVLRARLDSMLGALEMTRDTTRDAISSHVQNIRDIAREREVAIPEGSWPLSTASYWKNNRDDLLTISEICRADDFATQLHMTATADGEALAVRTEVNDPDLSANVMITGMQSLLESQAAAFQILGLVAPGISEILEEIRSLVPGCEGPEAAATSDGANRSDHEANRQTDG